MSTNACRLVTERLTIRPFVSGDLGDLYEILGDEETMRFLEPPYDLEKTWGFLNAFCMEKRGALAAEQRSDGKVIGYILFNEQEEHVFELGWIFNRRFWRQGFAYEACKAVMDNAFSVLKAKTVFSETADTVRSVALMRKLGMRFKGAIRSNAADFGSDSELYMYELSDEEWCSLHQCTAKQK